MFFTSIESLGKKIELVRCFFSVLSLHTQRKYQRKRAKTFFPRKKVLESKKGAGTTAKLTFVGSGTDGEAV